MSNLEYERVVDVTASYLGGLDKAKPVATWAVEHFEKVKLALEGYDQLVSILNSISKDSPLLEVMPKTAQLKQLLGNTDLPTVNEMLKGNFASALMDARGPMLRGQKIKRGEIVEPSVEDKNYAIGTPSMDTALAALAVGTTGHLLERTFFQWARKNGFNSEGRLKKDDWLQALDEAFLLMLVKEQKPILFEYFLKSNINGGLAWLNYRKVEAFGLKAEPLLKH